MRSQNCRAPWRQPRVTFQSLLQLAEVYTETNRPHEAEKKLREAISIATETGNDGQAGRSHYQLGRILEKTGRSQEAVQEMKIVAEIQKRLGPSPPRSQERMRPRRRRISPNKRVSRQKS